LWSGNRGGRDGGGFGAGLNPNGLGDGDGFDDDFVLGDPDVVAAVVMVVVGLGHGHGGDGGREEGARKGEDGVGIHVFGRWKSRRLGCQASSGDGKDGAGATRDSTGFLGTVLLELLWTQESVWLDLSKIPRE
jgi:hypothetical protein